MFDHRTGAMIVLSLLIAAPALVFADVEHGRDAAVPRAGEFQLAAATASTLEADVAPGMLVPEPSWHGRWKGVDFPVRNGDQFAHMDAAHTADGSGATSER